MNFMKSSNSRLDYIYIAIEFTLQNIEIKKLINTTNVAKTPLISLSVLLIFFVF